MQGVGRGRDIFCVIIISLLVRWGHPSPLPRWIFQNNVFKEENARARSSLIVEMEFLRFAMDSKHMNPPGKS